MSAETRVRTDELKTGDRLVAKDMTRFTVDSVTPAKTDWRFQGKQADGTWISESGMELVGHDESGEVVRFTAAQSYLWYRDVEAEEREKTAAVVAGALPVPFGPGPLRMTAVQGMVLAELIGDVKPATPKLLHAFGESVRDCREHEHPAGEDFHCLNLTAWMGERAGLVLRSLLDVEAENARLRARAAELEAERKQWRKTAHRLAGEAGLVPSAEASADKLTRLLAPTQALREDAPASNEPSAWQAAVQHIEGDGCNICHPKMRLPEMCPEGQRLSLAACDALGGA